MPSIIPHISINSPEVSTTSANLKFKVCKYFDKLTVDRARRAQCKLCPNVSYIFFLNVGLAHLPDILRVNTPNSNNEKLKFALWVAR